MKGYFSELARHTGVRIGSGGPTAVPAPPAASSQRNIHREVTGLDVEEVTFTGPSQPRTAGRTNAADPPGVETILTEAVGIRDRSDAQSLERAGADRDRDSESGSTRVHVPSDATVEVAAANSAGSKSRIKEVDLRSAEMEAAIIEQPRVVISENTSTSAQTPDSSQIPESVSAFDERNATSGAERDDVPDGNQQRRRVTTEREDPGRFSRAAGQSETGLEERVERQLIVRNYLKEISEWISTPASSEDEPASFISADSAESAEDLARRPDRSNISLPERSRADALEQQDLSLSIGTIKIVIEEPRKEAPAPPTPPAKPEPAFERTTTAPTDLSRYYLNRW